MRQVVQCLKQRCLFLLLPLLLCTFLSAALTSCGFSHCEAQASPPVVPQMFVTGGHVYLSAPFSGFYVLNASNGTTLPWTGAETFQAIDAGIVFLKDINSLIALRAIDGKGLWHRSEETQNQWDARAADGSVYLYQEGDGQLLALNGSTGVLRWQASVRPLTPASLSEQGFSMQAVAGVVYVHFPTGQFSAYREDNGALLWTRTFFFQSTGVPWYIVQGVVYLDADKVYALRASDGKVLWQRPSGSSFAMDQANGILYLLSGNLYALRASDGTVLWKQKYTVQYRNTLTLLGETLYVGSLLKSGMDAYTIPTDFSGTLNAFRASDGKWLWQDVAQQSAGSLAVQGGGSLTYVLDFSFITGQSTLSALQTSDGKVLWQHKDIIAAGLVFADNRLYTGYGGDNSTLECTGTGPVQVASFRSLDGSSLWHYQWMAAPSSTINRRGRQ